MTQTEKPKITIEVEGLERSLRRMIAAKEMIDAAIEAAAELLVLARPKGSAPPADEARPATFGSARREPVESAEEVPAAATPAWQEGLGETKG
jgi:hypothetical protein